MKPSTTSRCYSKPCHSFISSRNNRLTRALLSITKMRLQTVNPLPSTGSHQACLHKNTISSSPGTQCPCKCLCNHKGILSHKCHTTQCSLVCLSPSITSHLPAICKCQVFQCKASLTIIKISSKRKILAIEEDVGEAEEDEVEITMQMDMKKGNLVNKIVEEVAAEAEEEAEAGAEVKATLKTTKSKIEPKQSLQLNDHSNVSHRPYRCTRPLICLQKPFNSILTSI